MKSALFQSGDLKAIVERRCQPLIEEELPLLSLQGVLKNFSPQQKTDFLYYLVAELNEKCPFVKYIDLTWNELNPDNVIPLTKLKHNPKINLEFNNLDKSRKEDAAVLENVGQNVVVFQGPPPIQCR